jgi:hypothetical protein
MTDLATTQAAAIIAQALARLTAATQANTGTGGGSTAGAVLANGTVPLSAPWNAGQNITAPGFVGPLTGDASLDVKADGTRALTAGWNAGAFNITSLNSVGWVNVSQKATGGTGAIGSPWTGWDTAITWTGGVTYYAPAGFYSYATSPNFGKPGLSLIGDKPGGDGTSNYGTVFVCTGTGNVFIVDGRPLPSTNVKGVSIKNITAYTTNASSTATGCFYLNSVINGYFENLRCGGSAGAGFYMDCVQQSTFVKPVCSGATQWGAYQGVTPTNGIYMTSVTIACTTNQIIGCEIEGTSAYGIYITGSPMFNNVFLGGVVESCVGGINVDEGAFQNTFLGTDFEANTGANDILVYGFGNTFIGCEVGSAGTTNGIHVGYVSGTDGLLNTFMNCRLANKPILIDAGARGNRFEGIQFYGGITDNGTNSYFHGCYDSTNSKWYPDKVLQRFYSRATDTTAQSIANAAFQSLTWGTNTLDNGVHSTSVNPTRFTVPLGGAGLWQFDCAISFAANATGVRDVSVKKNGATLINYAQVLAGSPNQASCFITAHDLAVDGDYYEFQAFQNSGGALTIISDPNINFAQAKKVN